MNQKSSRPWYLYDQSIVFYCLFMVSLLLVFGRPLSHYVDEIAAYGVLAILTILIVRFADEQKGGISRFLRFLYPVLFFTVFYRLTEGTMFLFFGAFLDSQLIDWETKFFKADVVLYIDRHLLNVGLNELFSFCYLSYYLLIPTFTLTLYYKKRFDVLKSSLAAICLTFFLSYFLFFLCPIEGPRWYYASVFENSIQGFLFRPLVEFVIEIGAVRGGCMPSSHFGVALAILLYTFRLDRRAGWLLLPIVLGLGIGTVWGRFHYISDVIVGGVIAAGAVFLVWYYENRNGLLMYNSKDYSKTAKENVS